jgi:hypothetical protein
MNLRKLLAALASIGMIATIGSTTLDARAFPHVVRKGETLAAISKAVYGRTDLEHVLVGANALDAQGGSAIAPGMRLEIPTLAHARAALGDTWQALADRYLGDAKHAAVLAETNGSHPWLLPDAGAVIVVPYVLRHFAATDETIFDLAERYLGDKMLAWQLVVFNDLKKNDIKRGDVVLIPLKNLPLTAEGEAAALGERAGLGPLGARGARILERQRRIEAQLPALAKAVDDGRFIEAIGLGNRLLGMGDATRSQLARLGKLLSTAYVAVDATGAAIESCRLYLENANVVHLEPETTSPKLRAVCGQAP